MTDDANIKRSEHTEEKTAGKRAEEENPKQHGSEASGASREGHTGTELGSTGS